MVWGRPSESIGRGRPRRAHASASTSRVLLASRSTIGASVLLLLSLFSTTGPGLCSSQYGSREEPAGAWKSGKCIERERKALLAVRADISGAHQWLSSWGRDGADDCCRWKGVACDGHTGRVVKLDLRNPNPGDWLGNYSKVNPSLSDLGSLRHLDLSSIQFGGADVPSFIGSLVNLEYLNISQTNLGGPLPPGFFDGRLRNLRSLDLSGLTYLDVGDLHWLSHLPHLQHLDMSEVRLSAASDWLRAINTLPSLSVLRLRNCELPTPPITLPHAINLTSLSILDLSENYFTSTWPLWLSNISGLVSLALGTNFDPCPIPDVFGNMKRLEVLSLDRNDFQGVVPGSLWRLDNLRVLYLSGRNLHIGSTSSEDAKNLSSLQELKLSGVIGRLPDSLGNNAGLRLLELSNADIEFPKSLGNLSHLEHVEFSDNNITGGIPESFGHLANLKELMILRNGIIKGGIPESLGNLSRLEYLELSDNNVRGGGGRSFPESIGNLRGLKILKLYGGNVSRELLRNMGGLCNLTELSSRYNSAADGAEVTGLLEGLSRCIGGSALETLDLEGNRAGGHLPDQVGRLKNLRSLGLKGNSIVGSIPASIGDLRSLTSLDLSDNRLSGLIPSSIGELSNLTSLLVSSNNLEGVLTEAHFSHLSQLVGVDLSYNAALSLNMSPAWVPPFQLLFFDMIGCRVGPDFPKWLQTQGTLQMLDLSLNVISDSLEDDFFNSFPLMSRLNLSHNHMKGNLPASFSSFGCGSIDLSSNHFEASPLLLNTGFLSNGVFAFALDLSNNSISGPIVLNTSRIDFLDLSHNRIQGSIPPSICNVWSLIVLDLSYNYLSGQIPGCLGNLTSVTFMKLSNNRLAGQIPGSIGTLSQLTWLYLGKNNLTGVIPSSLKGCTRLETLDLGQNKLSGEIPAWVGDSLPSLQILRLRSNMFRGSIPKSLTKLQALRILDLARNRLWGTLLLPFRNFTGMVNTTKILESSVHDFNVHSSSTFEESIIIVTKGTELEYTTTLSLVTIIDLSGNNFSGQIPEEITSLRGLHFLNLSRNHLSGKIPENMRNMALLESLDLSFNELTGTIPSSMSTISFLGHFNVSHNNLSGRIPSGGQVQTFDQSSFVGNPDLCGAPILGPCPGDVTFEDPRIFQAGDDKKHDDDDKHEPYMTWFYVSMGPGFVTGFWGFLGVLLLVGRNKRIAYFRFIDNSGDGLYVMVMVHYARLKLKISRWKQARCAN